MIRTAAVMIAIIYSCENYGMSLRILVLYNQLVRYDVYIWRNNKRDSESIEAFARFQLSRQKISFSHFLLPVSMIVCLGFSIQPLVISMSSSFSHSNASL